ncbi:RNA-binding protein [Candidatus Peregrinibacteria bacterium CG10_big_fil_rev_8_21_14_0_10_55_24]|nr:MAG: RNA-binding protein [Candidatus Peregrinibacteria bacterium CG10_big_fil_rev_8_21_14_0_10_55_24]
MTAPADPATTPGYDFLKYVLESIVEDKEALSIETKIDDLGILLTVRVGDADMGKLIGKGGQTIKALRTLLRIVGGNTHRINMKVMEPGSV